MPDNSGSEGDAKAATMDDLSKVHAEIKSSMDAQMQEFRNMFLELKRDLATHPSHRIEDSDLLSAWEKAKAEAAAGETPEKDGDPTKNKNGSTSSQNTNGTGAYNSVPPFQSPDPQIPHHHINNIGEPPKINVIDFERWQFEFCSYMCRSCNELWRIVDKGFWPQHDSDNYTRREVVEAQLNSVALHMIQQVVGPKDLPFIMKHTIAKDAWDSLSEIYVGNENMKRNKYSALRNQA